MLKMLVYDPTKRLLLSEILEEISGFEEDFSRPEKIPRYSIDWDYEELKNMKIKLREKCLLLDLKLCHPEIELQDLRRIAEAYYLGGEIKVEILEKIGYRIFHNPLFIKAPSKYLIKHHLENFHLESYLLDFSFWNDIQVYGPKDGR